MVFIDVIVGQGDIKRVLPGNKADRHKVRPRNGTILTAVIDHPTRIPCAFGIWYRVAFRGLFANPKNSSNDVVLPRIWSAIRPSNIREKSCREIIRARKRRCALVMTIRSVENRMGKRRLVQILSEQKMCRLRKEICS